MYLWRSYWLAILLTLKVGCQSAQDNASEPDVFQNREKGRTSPFAASSCPPKSLPCTEEFNPVQCFATGVAGRRFFPWNTPYVWAENSCLGLEKLNQAVCQASLDPKHLSGVECIPDTSGGNCNDPKPRCPKEANLLQCVAASYSEQALAPGQKIRGWGYGSCEAQWEMRRRACESNLNPKMLGKVTCLPSPLNIDCAKKIALCKDKIQATRCRGTLKKDLRIVEASADSECAARALLDVQACGLDHPPSALIEVTCQKIE